eukprot:6195760-Pleurochrysis_carterae.AAC.1
MYAPNMYAPNMYAPNMCAPVTPSQQQVFQFNSMTGAFYAMPVPMSAPPAPDASQGQTLEKKVSPTFAKIEARLTYKHKKEQDLLEAQIMNEYCRTKYGA